MNDRIYTERKTVVGVSLGGPLAGGYYFWRNFTAFGMPKAARSVGVGAVLLLILTCVSMFIPALDRLPNVVYWGVQIGLTYGIYRSYLASAIEEHVEAGGAQFGWRNTILVGVVSMTITIVFFISTLYLYDSITAPSVKTYGGLQHEIVYKDENLTSAEVDGLAAALTSSGFFDNEMQKSVDASKDGDRYILNLYCNESAKDDPNFIQLVRGLRRDLQTSFPDNPIVIDLVVGTSENRIARIE